MKLTEPVDVYILRIFVKYGNMNPISTWWKLHTEYLEVNPEDESMKRWSTDYINQRLAELANNELLERFEPRDRSGLYRITEFGRAALEIYDDSGRANFGYADLISHVQNREEDGEE